MFPWKPCGCPARNSGLRIFEPRYGALVRECLSDEREFGVVLIAGRSRGGRRKTRGVTSARWPHRRDCQDFGDGRYHLACELRDRIRVTAWLEDDPYPRADVGRGRRVGRGLSPPTTSAVVEDRLMELFGADRRVAAGVDAASPELLRGARNPGVDAGKRLFALASPDPM